ncbi:hypothetical protein [Streptomyces sp. NPDC093544]|uniref:hypothetical protein n=1 Tax=Streptomyces sp. NPDC093544 TaxID=3155200 RepID=UPI00342E5A89
MPSPQLRLWKPPVLGASAAILVLGRHLNISYGDTAAHVEQARLRRFAWDACVLRPWSHA